MIERKIDDLRLWEFQGISAFNGVRHFVSGRPGGVSKGHLGDLNLSFKVGDLHENVVANRRKIAMAMGIDLTKLIFPSQTHSNEVKVVSPQTTEIELENTDALVTNAPGVCICVMSADCVPILLFDPVTNSVGAVHAGWRGTVGKILTATVAKMTEEYGVKPRNLIAGIGPSVCQQVYEVGEEVTNAFSLAYENTEKLIDRRAGGKAFINLWEANKIQLLELGVPAESVEVAGICTYKNSEKFFSARKSQNHGGRFAAGIMLSENKLF